MNAVGVGWGVMNGEREACWMIIKSYWIAA
jgi:hypothetical protein